MSKRELRLFLLDMPEAIRKIREYTSGLNFEEFDERSMVVDAVVRNLEIIGEAAKYIPEEIRARYSEINWSQVVGFRNIVIHKYFDVDTEIVWTIARERLGDLEKVLVKMFKDLFGEEVGAG